MTTKNQPATATTKTGPMLAGRQADSARRRQRVITILDRAAAGDGEISISGIARAALLTELPGVTAAQEARRLRGR